MSDVITAGDKLLMMNFRNVELLVGHLKSIMNIGGCLYFVKYYVICCNILFYFCKICSELASLDLSVSIILFVPFVIRCL